MKNFTKTFAVFALAMMFTNAFSQENYQPGYAINLQGDTIKGFIDYQDWRYNPKTIKFKQNAESQAVKYSPENILEFATKNDIYISSRVQIETSPDETSNLTSDAKLDIVERTVFLQTLIQGEKSLYSFESNDVKKNFYIGTDSGIDLLAYKKYIRRDSANALLTTSVAENNTYKSLLGRYLNDCLTIYSNINKMSYNKSNLMSVFNSYYKYLQKKPNYELKSEKIRLKFGVSAGISATSFKLSHYLPKWDMTSSIDFTGAVFFNAILPFNQKKWSIYNEVMYSKYKITGVYEKDDPLNDFHIYVDRHYKYTTTLDMGYIKLNNMIRYNYYSFGNTKLFINGGIGNGWVVRHNDKVVVETTDQGTTTSNEYATYPSKYEQSLIIGIGAQHKKYAFEFRYELGNGITSDLNSSSSRYFVLFSYQIN